MLMACRPLFFKILFNITVKINKMSNNTELHDYYKKVCELRRRYGDQKSQNRLSQEVVSVNDVYENATVHINKVCQYFNDCTHETLKARNSAYTISVGKESAPLIVLLKQLSDKVYKADINCLDMNTQELIQTSLFKVEDNLHCLDDLYKSTHKFVQSLEYLAKYLKNQDKLDKNLSTVSEISSFSDKDVVTSSPIN